MSHRRKARPDRNKEVRIGLDVGTCPTCLKKTWRTRKLAKRALQQAHPGSGLSVYPCPTRNGYHYGHLSARVKHGDTDRRDLRLPRPDQ